MALGPNYCNINGIWALKPYYLGTWTLRVIKVKDLGLRASGRKRQQLGVEGMLSPLGFGV